MFFQRFSLVSRVGAAALAALIFAGGCAHSARITTDPEGADIYVKGFPIGQSPVHYKTRSGLPETYYLKIEKPGYRTIKDAVIESTYRADVSLLLLLPGIIPYFFSARLEDQYVFHLVPERAEEAASAAR